MRPSDFFSEMEQMIVEMGMILGPSECLMSVFNRSSIFPDHLERISDVLKECVTDDLTDGRTKRHMEKLGLI